MMDEYEDFLQSLGQDTLEIKKLTSEKKSKIIKSGLIPRISVFSEEDAELMVFYTDEQWASLPEEKKEEYKATQAARDEVISNENTETELNKILSRMAK